jgi:hypothetical protein
MNSIRWNILVMIFVLLTSASAHPQEVTKDVWIESMSTALPTAFCQRDQYFRQCFDISQTECEETAMSATRVCLQKYKDKIPNILIQPKDGTYWGGIVGGCAGEAFQATLLKKRISSKRCNDPNSWKQEIGVFPNYGLKNKKCLALKIEDFVLGFTDANTDTFSLLLTI